MAATAIQNAHEEFTSFMVAHGAQPHSRSSVLYKGYILELVEEPRNTRCRGTLDIFIYREGETRPLGTQFSYTSLQHLRACFVHEFEITHQA